MSILTLKKLGDAPGRVGRRSLYQHGTNAQAVVRYLGEVDLADLPDPSTGVFFTIGRHFVVRYPEPVSGVIAVLATPATFQGELFASVVDRFAGEARIVCRACRGWVELVERGATEGPEAESLVASHLQPVLAEGADVLVLACTHYPFLATTIGRLAGEAVTIIDPAEAVARQTARLATARGKGDLEICVTGPTDGLAEVVERLTGLDQPIRTVTLGP